MSDPVSRGANKLLEATTQTGTGAAISGDPVRVDIIDPSSSVIVTDGVPTNPSLGHYSYTYPVPVNAPLGVWTAHWTATINGAPVSIDDLFEVVLAGEIEVPPGSSIPGHTIDEWRAKVGHLLRDVAGVDLMLVHIDEAGLEPAFADFARDYPYRPTVDVASAGTAFLPVPSAWVQGRSRITGIEYPIGQNPPSALDQTSWAVARSPTNVAIDTILLLDAVVPIGSSARVTFEAPSWPFPDDDAASDQIDNIGFEAVASLAGAKCLYSLAAEAARNRDGALPTDLVAGDDRVRDLLAVAARLESTYQRLLGLDSDDRPERKRVGTIHVTVPS